ncbi:MAG TPA: TatD family hydrolase [Polyangiaceae bacterium]|jgi:TatD DNase family protein|nr:TatD family hydrolase [Polyangiaceae bacterium]
MRPGNSSRTYFDTHCHLDFAQFDADRAALWADARSLGLRSVFIPGVSPAQWQRLASIQSDIEGACVGVGLHPHFLSELDASERASSIRQMSGLVTTLGAVAVGECGLDGRLPKRGGPSVDEQERALLPQLELAVHLKLPVVLHVVDAHGRVLELLERLGPLPAGGVLHAYSGSAELVPRYCALGLYFGFGGAVTHERAAKARRALACVPKERLLLETDAPDQAPAGWTSQSGVRRNEPAALLAIAAVIAQILGISEDELAQRTTANAERLFRLAVKREPHAR